LPRRLHCVDFFGEYFILQPLLLLGLRYRCLHFRIGAVLNLLLNFGRVYRRAYGHWSPTAPRPDENLPRPLIDP
jgi:hypothetical protein